VRHRHDQLLDLGVDASTAVRALVLLLLERGIYEADHGAVDHGDQDGTIGFVDSAAVPALQGVGIRDVAEGRLPLNDLIGDLEVQPDDRGTSSLRVLRTDGCTGLDSTERRPLLANTTTNVRSPRWPGGSGRLVWDRSAGTLPVRALWRRIADARPPD
jgi:hypothetical protein